MKKDRFKNFDNDTRDLVLRFESARDNANPPFFDLDELEVIIDYYFEVNDMVPLEQAIVFAEHLYPKSVSIRLRRAHLLMANLRYDQALKILDTLRREEPDNTDVAYSLGVANGALGKSEKAIAYFKEAARDGWLLGRVYSNMAEEYYKMKDYDSALLYYRKAMQTDSYDDVTIYNFYDVSFETGRLQQAIEQLQSFVGDNPYCKEAWYCLGCAYRDMTLYEKAVDALEYAIAIDKEFLDAYVALSQSQDFMGHTSDAVSTMLRVLDFADDKAKVYRTIGSLYAREANYSTAMAYFTKAIEEDASDAEAYASLALCCMEMGDLATARAKVNRALFLDQASLPEGAEYGNPEVLCAAAMIYDALDEFYQASEYFEQLIASGMYTEPQCQMYTQFLFKHKVYDIVIAFAEESLEAFPHSSFYSTYLAAAYFYTNRYNKARQMLPDVSSALLADICPEIMTHHLLGPLVPPDPFNSDKQ